MRRQLSNTGTLTMQLLSKAHYLVFVTGPAIKKASKKLGYYDGVWVAYGEHGNIVGHVPYQQDQEVRDVIMELAKAKMEQFKHAG
jgi:hypothetical protein